MDLDDPARYEAALRRLIELRKQAERTGKPSAEAEQLQREIYAMIRQRPNPLADIESEPDDAG
jgi:hypothetical protein